MGGGRKNGTKEQTEEHKGRKGHHLKSFSYPTCTAGCGSVKRSRDACVLHLHHYSSGKRGASGLGTRHISVHETRDPGKCGHVFIGILQRYRLNGPVVTLWEAY